MYQIYCAVPEKFYTHPIRSLEFHRGRGILKVKILEAKFEANWNFLEGGEGGGGGV